MESLKFSKTEIEEIFQIIIAILQIGNLEFIENDKKQGAMID